MDAGVTQGQASRVLPIAGNNVRVVRNGRGLLIDLNITIAAGGSLTVFIGPNGAGKSLSLRVLASLLEPDQGQVTWAGLPPNEANRRAIGFVFQRPILLRRSALANIGYALKIAGIDANARPVKALEILRTAGLEAMAASPARLLSGGEQQRLALARALALNPEVLFLDEPAANLDPASTAAIEAQLKTVVAGGVHVVMVTQDLKQARRVATAIVMMHKGRVLEHTDAANFFARPVTAEAQMFLDGQLLV